ncbi:MAG TPA: iron uptake system protein EfeO [Solirubrobacteraceae bacterium]|nr:iron uptake system protein EfeO [Solirubrobacteraceae bacterium]
MIGRTLKATPLLTALALAGCGGGGGPHSSSLKFTLTDQGCLPDQASVPAGPVTFTVTNGGSTLVTELELQNGNGIIIGERENVLPGLSGSFSLDLQPGTYVLNCPDGNVTQGKLTVTGKPFPVRGSSDVLTKTAVLQYRTYVEHEIAELVTGTRRFVAAIEQGNLEEAKRLYGPVRRHYEAIEPVADSFPGLDSSIDARIDSPTVAGDVSKWTGFHRIEQLMWVKKSLRGAGPLASRLLSDVELLQQKVPTLPLAATQLVNGSVQLLNEIVNVKITGEEDRYSHTDLSDFQGNLIGARKAFEYLRPTLERKGDAELSRRVAQKFRSVQEVLNRYKRDTPLGFALYGALSEADKRTIAKEVGEVAQELSTVAEKLAIGG